MATKPTPKVMAMKYFPSRVVFRRRGGRKRRESEAESVVAGERDFSLGACEAGPAGSFR
jgi:hypothetical protein